MAFSDTQARQLKAKLDPKFVKVRKSNGVDLHYVEGWHAIAEANRIFGFDAWDRRTVATRCVWTATDHPHYLVAYVAKVRIRVRADDVTVIRDGSGTGEARALTPGQAHDMALKSAETDATKRALATFANPFGLALYDRDQNGVRKPRSNQAGKAGGPWILRSGSGSGAEAATFDKPSDFAAALRKAMSGVPDIETLFAIWEQNVDVVRALSRALKQDHLTKSGIAPQLVAHLKSCAIALAKPNGESPQSATSTAEEGNGARHPKIDKSTLAIGEPRRIRCKAHLQYVASQPCVICGRSPSHAHHLRHAQPRGLGLKVSDEFTVPLCSIHHDEIHRTLREKQWWQERKIDPLAVAGVLWRESCKRLSPSATDPAASDLDPLNESKTGDPQA